MVRRIYKTGQSREQASLLPPRIEDYVGADNAVRAIEAYVSSLDLLGLGFRDVGSAGGAGQPPYDPADLLKLYLYGYLNQVRSSRRLEREARRNLEVIWLLRGLTPGYRTIGDFRKANAAALRSANRAFVQLVHRLGLLGGELVGIDGAFFHGDASQASVVTQDRLTAQLAGLERSIEAYEATLASNDQAEDTAAASEELAGLRERQARAAAELARLAASGETQLSRTDPDARQLSKRGQSVTGYNVQIAVDDKHKLIVASEVVNDGNDSRQLHALALAAKQALGVASLRAVADPGYYNAALLKACEDASIVAFVPSPDRNRRLAAQGRFTLLDFRYDAEADVYHCPQGAALRPMRGLKRQATGKQLLRYVSRRADCRTCPLRQRCLAPKARRREIERWEHEDVIERLQARMQADGAAMMRRRKAIAEHPFGTLKCRAGYRHFLLRGFDKVRGEWSLMALCYNFSRLLSIIGIQRCIAVFAALRSDRPFWLRRAATRAIRCLVTLGAALYVAFSSQTFLVRLSTPRLAAVA